MTNMFYDKNYIYSIVVNFLRANDDDVLQFLDLFPEQMLHFLCNPVWQNRHILRAYNIRKLQKFFEVLKDFFFLKLKVFLLMQWIAGASSKRFRQTLQNNFLLCVIGSDQQCATGF